jgi:hypothetical protein
VSHEIDAEQKREIYTQGEGRRLYKFDILQHGPVLGIGSVANSVFTCLYWGARAGRRLENQRPSTVVVTGNCAEKCLYFEFATEPAVADPRYTSEAESTREHTAVASLSSETDSSYRFLGRARAGGTLGYNRDATRGRQGMDPDGPARPPYGPDHRSTHPAVHNPPGGSCSGDYGRHRAWSLRIT